MKKSNDAEEDLLRNADIHRRRSGFLLEEPYWQWNFLYDVDRGVNDRRSLKFIDEYRLHTEIRDSCMVFCNNQDTQVP